MLSMMLPSDQVSCFQEAPLTEGVWTHPTYDVQQGYMILAVSYYITTSYFLTTASESSLPGKKRTRSLAGTSIGLRSRGLTPFRAAL